MAVLEDAREPVGRAIERRRLGQLGQGQRQAGVQLLQAAAAGVARLLGLNRQGLRLRQGRFGLDAFKPGSVAQRLALAHGVGDLPQRGVGLLPQ